jgi:epoxyqueuosine reductase
VRSLKAQIKAEARRLGFSHVGVTLPGPPSHFPTYKDWIKAGRYGEMHYLAGERALSRRSDPRRILPECRSILALAMPHPAPDPGDTKADPGHGLVGSYAWGRDYHEVFKPLLQALVVFIEQQMGRAVPNRWYTDTGPILERDLAQAAGLGWIGKNTCLIHPQGGSYFLLAEILLGLELEPDQAFASDHCGSCTRCLEACPTACIRPDRTIDARSCISYLTIELKGPIPVEWRSKIGDWVFGCDVCQQVCPWNIRFSHSQGTPVFEPQGAIQDPLLVEELSLSPQSFNRKFKGSPVKRAKRRGYLRNVAVVLGNQQDPGSIPALQEALLGEPEALVRGHVAWALGQIGTQAARAALQRARRTETESQVLEEIRDALAQIDSST